MIAFIRGRVIVKRPSYVVVETGNIGYQIFAGETFLNELSLGEETEMHIYHQVREEASDLYGFKRAGDLELFELLLSVSGIGPKSALGILNIADAEDIKEAIRRDDAALLTKVSGIGKKTAERLVLELKNKVVKLGVLSGPDGKHSLAGGDELDALVSLGYSLLEARNALNELEGDITDSGERVKAALRRLAGR